MKHNVLMVKINGEWEYVFCRNERQSSPVTTKNIEKAVNGQPDSLTYFQKHFGQHEFKIE